MSSLIIVDSVYTYIGVPESIICSNTSALEIDVACINNYGIQLIMSNVLLYHCRFYDTSKQGFGATLIHFANVFISQTQQGSDPCIW